MTTATQPPKPKTANRSNDGVAAYLIGGPCLLSTLLDKVFNHPQSDDKASQISLARVLSEDVRFGIGDDAGRPTAFLVKQKDAAPAPVEQPKSIQDMVDADAKLAADVAALHAASPKLPDAPVPASVAPLTPTDAAKLSEIVAAPMEQAAVAAPAVAIAADATMASMQAEIDRLRGEVILARHDADAYREKISNQHDAAAKVASLEAKMEAAKATVGGIKLELAAANTALASLVLGDAQQTHPALKPGTPPTDEDDDEGDDNDDGEVGLFAGATRKPKAKAKKEPKPKGEKKPRADKVPMSTEPSIPWSYGVAPDQIVNADSLDVGNGYTQAQLRAALVEHIPQGVEVAKLKPKQVVTVKGIPHLARQANDTGTRWFLQVLYSQPEWNGSGLADTYGRPVEGLDDHAEGKANREKGGPDCGRMVKIGAKLYVLTPESLGTVLTFEQGDRAALPVDGTPAAAIANAMATHSVGEGAKEPEAQPDAGAAVIAKLQTIDAHMEAKAAESLVPVTAASPAADEDTPPE